MKTWQWAVAGLGFFAAALACIAPASIIDQRLAAETAGRVRIADSRGTLWSGDGRVEVRDGAGRSVVSRRLAWRFVPRDLLSARIGYRLALAPQAQPINLRFSLTGLEVSAANIALPAAALGQALPALQPFGLSGQVVLALDGLSIGRDSTRVQGSVVWRGAGSALSPLAPLGDYRLQVSGTGPELQASLATLAGPLQLDGSGRWSAGGPLEFLATATVPADQREQLAPFLRLIAVEQPDGRFIRQQP